MLNKQNLIDNIETLLECAKKRNTTQGIMIYEDFIKKISNSSDDELDGINEAINTALSGIEAHGYFTDEEYRVVKYIRDML